MRRVFSATLCLAIVVTATAAPAQTKLAGQWSVHSSQAFRNLHSGDTTIVEETAQLILHPRGDSVFGVWQREASGGEMTPAPRTVRGTMRGDTVRVQVDATPHDDDGFFAGLGRDIVEWLKTHVHNMPPTIPLLEFTIRGDSLTGTRRSMTLDGVPTSMSRPFSGTRLR